MDDLISRQTAIDALQKEINKGIPPFNDVVGSIRCGVRLARNIIEDLPSAQTERKTGWWVPQNHNRRNGYVTTTVYFYPKCSECGYSGNYGMNYCPNCGARMEKQDG